MLFDEVGVHLKVEHHLIPVQAEQAFFQLLLQLRVVALVFGVPRDTGRKQGLFLLRGLGHGSSSSLCVFASSDFQYMQRA